MTRGIWWRAVLIVVSTSGCDLLFQLDRVTSTDAGSGSGGDASHDGPPVATCTQPIVHDTFDNTTPCMSWGSLFVDAGTYSTGGGLFTITPTAGVMSAVTCISNGQRMFGMGGVAVRVPSIVHGGNTYTMLQVRSGTFAVWMIATGDNMLRFQDGPMQDLATPVPYSPASTVWWRLRPTGPSVVAEYSANGTDWTPLGALATALPMSVDVQLSVAAYSSTIIGNTTFDELLVCP